MKQIASKYRDTAAEKMIDVAENGATDKVWAGGQRKIKDRFPARRSLTPIRGARFRPATLEEGCTGQAGIVGVIGDGQALLGTAA
ncbi:MAG: hypothetical protein ACREDC_13580, partial [Bradyrhizobium sp.]